MTDAPFYVFIGVSVIAWGIHGALMAHYARKFDGLIVAVYRNLSFVVTMLPLLFFSTQENILSILEHGWTLFWAVSTGAVAYVSALSALQHLPMGIGTALRQVAYVPLSVLLGLVWFNEHLTSIQLIILVAILVNGVALSLIRSDVVHLDPNFAWRGVALALFGGVFAAFTFYYFSVLARESDPFVATYFWEVGVGVVSAGYMLFLIALGKYNADLWLPRRDAVRIVLISLLTIIASVGYAFAVNHGPYALASGLVTTTVLIATLAGRFLFKERLTKVQIFLIVLTALLLSLLRMFS